jgi:hypothetical protein
VLAGQTEQSLNAADRNHSLLAVHLLGQRAGVLANPGAAEQQLLGRARHVRGAVFGRDAVIATLLVQMFTQQLAARP